MSVNKVILVGRLGQDPEVRYTPSGAAVANFSVATNENWVDKSGQKQERTEWHRVVVWGKRAELCQQYLSKGRQVYLEGRLQTRSWDDKDGQKRYTTEVQVSNLQFLGGGADRGAGMGGGAYQQGGNDLTPDMGSQQDMGGSGSPDALAGDFNAAAQNQPASNSFTEDDIPF